MSTGKLMLWIPYTLAFIQLSFIPPLLAPNRRSSLQSGRPKEEEGDEQPAVPSFQEAFNDALLSASVAVQNCELSVRFVLAPSK